MSAGEGMIEGDSRMFPGITAHRSAGGGSETPSNGEMISQHSTEMLLCEQLAWALPWQGQGLSGLPALCQLAQQQLAVAQCRQQQTRRGWHCL